MSGEGEQLDQLGAEAAHVADALKATDATRGSEPRTESGTATGGAPHDEVRGEGAPAGAPEGDEPHAEVVENPAPSIKALLTMARDVPMVRSLLPQAFVAALDDAAITELAEAFGDLAVKYNISMGGSLAQQWRVELRAALAVGSIAFSIWRAMHADDDAARAGRARDVSETGAPGYTDPPNPARNAPPVEPGA